MLLHGDDIAAAQSWADKRKPDAPEITQLMQAFIAASKQAESTRLRRNRMVTVLIGLLVVALAVGAAAWWNQDRLKEEIYIWTNVTVLELYTWTNVTALKTAQERAVKALDFIQRVPRLPRNDRCPSRQFHNGLARWSR